MTLMMTPRSLTSEQHQQFQQDGFLVLEQFIDRDFATRLADRFEPLLAGEFETGTYPDDGSRYISGRYQRIGDTAMDESFFPILWTESGYRSPFLTDYCTDALGGCEASSTPLVQSC